MLTQGYRMLVAIIRTQPIVLIRSAVQLLNDHPALKLNKKYSGRLEMFKIVEKFRCGDALFGFSCFSQRSSGWTRPVNAGQAQSKRSR